MVTGDQLLIGKETSRQLGLGTDMYSTEALLEVCCHLLLLDTLSTTYFKYEYAGCQLVLSTDVCQGVAGRCAVPCQLQCSFPRAAQRFQPRLVVFTVVLTQRPGRMVLTFECQHKSSSFLCHCHL